MNRMTGHAPVNSVYRIANEKFMPGTMLTYITRCRYATLARMARAAGDLPYRETKKLRTRLKALTGYGLVRYMPGRRCYELTADGWLLLVQTEELWNLVQDGAR